MNIGKACAIFENIKSNKHTEQEKLNAIKQVLEMPTHNGILKHDILDAFRWFFDWAVEEASIKQTNADRIRSMSDEELAEFLVNFKNTFGEEHEGEQSCLEWLQSEVER